MFPLLRSSRHDDITAGEDYAVLADGSLFVVPRANLAAAKELLAAQRAAERRVAGQPLAAAPQHIVEEQRKAIAS